jgi:crotonobetainyl-CoA:carnitine CoA-transferase CaiB-like acyl-CoA transferase
MSITGFPDGPPTKAGPAFIDFMGGIHLYAGIVTALYERGITGQGRLVEVAMQEAAYPSLASSLGFLYNSSGQVPPRTGNRHGGMSMAPYNVYRCADGYMAIICVVEEHWPNLLKAMGREDLLGDERYIDNRARVQRIDEVDALVEAWSSKLPKREAYEIARRNRVACAPVRDLVEVANDPHMHQRGMLEHIDHPELGDIIVPTSPLRFHGSDRPATTPSPYIGEHNDAVYGGWLGLSADEIAELRKDGVI